MSPRRKRTTRSQHVLLVDDDPISLALLEDTFADIPQFETTSRTDGRGALEACGETRYDLVIIDVRMEDIDGFTACASIKREPVYGAPAVIMISGMAGATTVENALRVGADAFIAKPFTPALLRETVMAQLSAVPAAA